MGRESVQIGDAVQAQCLLLLKVWAENPKDVYRIGTRRRRGDFQGTMQSAGLADIEAFLPPPPGAVLQNFERKVQLKMECKAGAGRLSEDQARYRQNCLDAGIQFLVGDLNALIAWGCKNGYAVPEQFPHYRQPQP